MIAQNSIDNCRDAARVEEIVGQFVQLKKQGAALTGLCPFHTERTPSFTVNPAKGFYKCFGCGAGGDSIKFLMEHEKLSYPDAVRWIANRYNIALEETTEERSKEQLDAEDLLLKVNETALQLWRSKLDDAHVQWLIAERKLYRETIAEWRLGYAPSEWRSLTPQLIEAGYYEPANELGLIKTKDDKHYDQFRDRVMIPIHNPRGQLVAFGGRYLGDEPQSPKYLNSSDSPLYHKEQVLFGLYEAATAIRKLKNAYLVEGYFDVISLHQKNILNAVAPCGTSLTDAQAKLLRRYTPRVTLFYDGDKAGQKATVRSLEVLLRNKFEVDLLQLPDGEDPDSFSWHIEQYSIATRKAMGWTTIEKFVVDTKQDAVLVQIDSAMIAAGDDTRLAGNAIERICELLSLVDNQFQLESYLRHLVKHYKLKAANLQKMIAGLKKDNVASSNGAVQEDSEMPTWVDTQQLYRNGFVMLNQERGKDKVGIYFKSDSTPVKRYTNFTIKPLYHIPGMNNNRRLIEVWNGIKKAVVEMQSRAFVSQDAFEISLIEKGSFTTEPWFSKHQFKRIVGYLAEEMPLCYELNTLGWQSKEAFFAFSNKTFYNGQVADYDELGIVKIGDSNFLSPGVSSIHTDEREDNNPYENDLYLKYVDSKHTFEQWAAMFNEVYQDNGAFGIAFVFITIYKDIVTRTTKCPLLYAYGPKGSGKSDFAESITWLFFSGKNADGKLIQGFNLNPGQGTPFSFFSRRQRYRNCALLFNEFDENNIEDWKFGAFKASYDGEGREVGDGDTGKKRKTVTQKNHGTDIIVGQFLSIRDDGSVLSRSITCPFNLEKLKNLTEDRQKKWKQLKDAEQDGLSSIVCELLEYRPLVKEKFDAVFWEEYTKLNKELKGENLNIEVRLLKNYTLCLAMVRIMGDVITLPFKYEAFYRQCYAVISSHNSLLRENNALNGFWKTIEFLYDQKQLEFRVGFDIDTTRKVWLQADGKRYEKEFGNELRRVLYLRLSMVHPLYAVSWNQRTKKAATNESTVETYLKDQSYYIGMCPGHRFKDKNTSCYVIDYDKLMDVANVVLDANDADDRQGTVNGAMTYAERMEASSGQAVVDFSKKANDLPF